MSCELNVLSMFAFSSNKGLLNQFINSLSTICHISTPLIVISFPDHRPRHQSNSFWHLLSVLLNAHHNTIITQPTTGSRRMPQPKTLSSFIDIALHETEGNLLSSSLTDPEWDSNTNSYWKKKIRKNRAESSEKT